MKPGYRIAVIGGDGIGPEITAEALKLMDVIGRAFDLGLEYKHLEACGEYYLKTGKEWEPDTYALCRDWADAILFGAWGWPGANLPDGDMAGLNVLFGIRFGLDTFANVRPCKLYPGVKHKIHDRFQQVWDPGKVDFVVIRENSEGEFVPIRGNLDRAEVRELSADLRLVTRRGIERIVHFAFQLARKRGASPVDGKKRVTCVDKSNVYASCKLFRRIFDEVAEQYPDIERDYSYIDIITLWMVRNPENYHVIVCPNQFGDIITDLAAALQGGMGMAAGANIGVKHAMFEPIHGSAPKYARQNRANPIASILTAGLMLEWLGEQHADPRLVRAAGLIDRTVARVLAERRVVPHELGGTSTCSEVGDEAARVLGELAAAGGK